MDEGRIEAIEYLLAWVIANTRLAESLQRDMDSDLLKGMDAAANPILGHYERILEISLKLQAAAKQ